MTKKAVNIRIEESLIATFDAWCAERDWSRTQAIERFMQRPSVILDHRPRLPPSRDRRSEHVTPVPKAKDK